eukprot:TRINITY_DN3191_c0_g1_i1.p1 TRINITY_DN3191_c0_g1~~TRINITY_DN3191_c0_g1_i1.p1  ORF type:complete len:200 (-),score=25.10 TRINITY_DN3191_c0_g1_i1:124-723(-)
MDGLDGVEDMLTEAAILIHVQENLGEEGLRYIVPFVGFCMQIPTVALLLEYCEGGDLQQRLADSRGSCPPQMGQGVVVELDSHVELSSNAALEQLRVRVEWALQVAQALNALHSIGVAHMDVKTDNVLLTDDRACLTDYGCALADVPHVKHGSQLTHVKAETGTLAFMAPELAADSDVLVPCDPFACDIFSFGFLLYNW